jgi:hypothetical protein
VDSAGNAYVTGQTNSINFPTVNPEQPANAGNGDAFVAKISADGATKIYATYLGGAGGAVSDSGLGIAVDSNLNAYVVGQTDSPAFPLMGTIQPFSGFIDAFVTKLNPSGSAILYSTYLGGTSTEQGTGIAVDNVGNAYVSGLTFSGPFGAAGGFPTKAAFQATNLGNENAFVAKLNTNLTGSASLTRRSESR